jgi:phosphoribosyl-ATP pyrophosphohydrolase
MKKVHDKILDWAEQRGLLYGPDIQPEKQMLKLVEEVGETAKALAYGDEDGLKDGIGDCVVCLIVLAEQKGLRSSNAWKRLTKRYLVVQVDWKTDYGRKTRVNLAVYYCFTSRYS